MNIRIILVGIALVCLQGCASNPNGIGQAISGILSGIGTGLSNL